MDKSTEALANEIQNADNIEKFLKTNEDEFLKQNLETYIKQLITERGIPIAKICDESEKGDYLYKILRGERNATRDMLICVAIALKAEPNEVKHIFRLAEQRSLDPRDKRDAVALYCLSKKMSVREMNEILSELNEKIFE